MSAYDAKIICNLGLGKITASRITQLSPARTELERRCAEGYPHWRDDELTQRVWVFAWVKRRVLVRTGDALENDDKPYGFAVPNDMLLPLRDKSAEWEQRGNFIFSAHETLPLDYIRRATENEFVTPFAEVLACRVARECVEHVTMSNTKGETAEMKYDKAVRKAAKMNAFVIGPEDVRLADDNSEWLTSRWY